MSQLQKNASAEAILAERRADGLSGVVAVSRARLQLNRLGKTGHRDGIGSPGAWKGKRTMRLTILLPFFLLVACVESRMGLGTPTVVYGDLRLDDQSERAALRQRVAEAVRNYCAAERTPQTSTDDYCVVVTRRWIIGKMRPEVRRAYLSALREAGVKGQQL